MFKIEIQSVSSTEIRFHVEMAGCIFISSVRISQDEYGTRSIDKKDIHTGFKWWITDFEIEQMTKDIEEAWYQYEIQDSNGM